LVVDRDWEVNLKMLAADAAMESLTRLTQAG
jgi:hypothetical protein